MPCTNGSHELCHHLTILLFLELSTNSHVHQPNSKLFYLFGFLLFICQIFCLRVCYPIGSVLSLKLKWNGCKRISMKGQSYHIAVGCDAQVFTCAFFIRIYVYVCNVDTLKSTFCSVRDGVCQTQNNVWHCWCKMAFYSVIIFVHFCVDVV